MLSVIACLGLIAGSTLEGLGSELLVRDGARLGLSGTPDLGGLMLDPLRHDLRWWHAGGKSQAGEGGGQEGTLGYLRTDMTAPVAAYYSGLDVEIGGVAMGETYNFPITSRGVSQRYRYESPRNPSVLTGTDFGNFPGSYSPGAATLWRGQILFCMSSDDLILDLVPRGRFLVHSLPLASYPAATSASSRLIADGSEDLQTQFGRMLKMGVVAQSLPGGGEMQAGILLAANGDLFRFYVDPVPGLDIAAHRIATGVTDFSIRHENVRSGGALFGVPRDVLYVTLREKGAEPSALITLDPVTEGRRVLYSALPQVRLTSVGHDSTHVFVAERDLQCSVFFGVPFCELKEGRIRSKTRGDGFRFLTDQEADANWAVVEEGWGIHLCSDGKWVFFSRGAEIRRFPSDAPPVRVNIKPVALEVVQTVQDLNNSVPLVAGKAAFARGYAQVTENTTDRPGWFVSGRLEVKRGVEFLGTLQPIRAGYVDRNKEFLAMRGGDTRDFLFEIPSAWVQPGDLTVTFIVNPGGGIPEQGTGVAFDNHRTETLRVLPSRPLELQFHPVEAVLTINYDPLTDSGFPAILSRALSLMPVPDIRWSVRSKVVTGPYDPANSDDWSDALDELSSSVFMEDVVRGNTALFHAGAFGYWSPRPSTGSVMLGLGQRPGRSLLFRVDDESESANFFGAPNSGVTLAHELGHNLGVKHVNNAFTTVPFVFSECADFFPNGPFEPYPYDGCGFGLPSLVPASNVIQRLDLPFGFDAVHRRAVSPWAAGDLMSYRGRSWTSPYTWRRMLEGVSNLGGSSLAGVIGLADVDQADVPVVAVRGLLNSADGGFQLREVLRLPTGWVSKTLLQESLASMEASTSPWKVELQDAAGSVVASYRLVSQPADEGDSKQETVLMLMPDPGNLGAVLVRDPAQQTVSSRAASSHVPVAGLAGDPEHDPLTSRLHLQLLLSDEDGDPVTATVQYSGDNGSSWRVVARDIPAGPLELDTRFLPGGESCRIRMLASDGFLTSEWTSAAFSLPGHSPELITGGITEGAVIDYGTPLVLEAAGFDAEDGGIPSEVITWEVIGNTVRVTAGGRLVYSEFAPGRYEAYATIYDSEGNSTRKGFGFEVRPAVIPDAASAPVLDGEVSEEAYMQALSLPLPAAGAARARWVHVPPYLFLGVTGLPYREDGSPATFRVSINEAAAGLDVPTAKDLRFSIDDLGRITVESGDGTGFVPDAVRMGAVVGSVSRGAGEWSAELRLHEAAIGGWGHRVTAALQHEYQAPGQAGPATWPSDIGAPEVPLTWAQVSLGNAGLPSDFALTVVRDEAGQVWIRWPMELAGCVLESTGDVAAGLWEAVTPSPAPGATEHAVPPGEPARFYRMRCP